MVLYKMYPNKQIGNLKTQGMHIHRQLSIMIIMTSMLVIFVWIRAHHYSIWSMVMFSQVIILKSLTHLLCKDFKLLIGKPSNYSQLKLNKQRWPFKLFNTNVSYISTFAFRGNCTTRGGTSFLFPAVCEGTMGVLYKIFCYFYRENSPLKSFIMDTVNLFKLKRLCLSC